MRLFILSLFIIFANGCNSDNSSNEDDIIDYNELYVSPVGEWKTICISSDNDGLWKIGTYIFTTNTVKSEWIHFSDEYCEIPTTDVGYRESLAGFEGSYKFLKHIESTNGLKANSYEISTTFLGEPLTTDFGFHFEFEKMSIVQVQGNAYYISYTPTFNLIN